MSEDTPAREATGPARRRCRPARPARPDPLDRPSPGRRAAGRCRSRGTSPSFDGATGWLNSEPLTPEGLRGRVVLVDFWTYTCVNWLRTLPYVRAWAAKYARRRPDRHRRPHARSSASSATSTTSSTQTRTLGVEYPVAIDSDYGVWRAFGNHFWPAIYLADAEGRIRFHHFGEGEYAMTEMVIQQLLLDAGAQDVDQDLVDGRAARASRSPPTGGRSGRPRRTSGTARAPASRQEDVAAFDEPHVYAAPARLPLNYWGLSGELDRGPPRRGAERARRTDRVPVPRPRRQPRDGAGDRAARRSRSGSTSMASSPGDAHGSDVAADGSGTSSTTSAPTS